MKKIGTIFVIGFFAIFFALNFLPYFFTVNTEPTLIDDSRNYQIENYIADVVISKENTLTVTEEIDVHFSTKSHGIFRGIPQIANITSPLETGEVTKRYKLDFSVISVNHTYKSFYENNIFYIQMGDSDKYANTNSKYILTYTVSLGDDRISAYDQFYYNILGNVTNTTVANAEISVTFPTALTATQAEQTRVFKGNYGSTTQIENLTWQEENTLLSFSAQNLQVGEGITVRTVLENGYFTPAFSGWFSILATALTILVVFLSFILYNKTTTKKFVVPVVQFTAKDKFTSADVGYIMDRKVQDKDIASLIIFWAQKGYAKIVEKQEGKKTKTYLQKSGDLPNNATAYEKTFFASIFSGVNNDELLDIKTLGEKAQHDIRDIKTSVEFQNEHLFKRSAINARAFVILLAGLLVAGVSVLLALQTLDYSKMLLGGVAGALLIFILFTTASRRDYEHFNNKKLLGRIMLLLSLALLSYFFISTFEFALDYALSSFFILAATVAIFFMVYKFQVRSEEGVDELGDIIGLKNFIEATEKTRLEVLLKDDPQLFYDILPYAYVLGIEQEWCKKFEGLVVEAPNWYVADASLDIIFSSLYLNTLLNNTCNSYLNSLANAQMSKLAEVASSFGGGSGGGSISGGGFSGGGAGGGGVGRW